MFKKAASVVVFLRRLTNPVAEDFEPVDEIASEVLPEEDCKFGHLDNVGEDFVCEGSSDRNDLCVSEHGQICRMNKDCDWEDSTGENDFTFEETFRRYVSKNSYETFDGTLDYLAPLVWQTDLRGEQRYL